mgnify:CR=1 FL=1
MAIKFTSPFFKKNLYLTIAICILFLIIGFLPILNHEQQSNLLVEHGLFESLTVYLYFLCLIFIFLIWPWKKILSKWYFSALIILFALRELDYDKIYFTHGVLKSRQYFSDLVSFPEYLTSIFILLFVFVVLISIILKEREGFIKGIKSNEQPQLAILISIILVAITKTIDGAERKFGIDLSDSIERLNMIIEEVGEMGIPIMFAIAIISSQKKGLMSFLKNS